MNIQYNRTIWQNDQTALNAQHMNNVEEGILNIISAVNLIPNWVFSGTKPSYTASDVGADPAGTAAQIIDNFAGAIYGVSGTTTLYSGSWSSNTYNISVASLGEYDAIFFSPITALDKSYLETANIIITTSGTTVTFTCVTSPTNNIGLNYFIARGKQ